MGGCGLVWVGVGKCGCVNVCIYIYIYIYIRKGREKKERERRREGREDKRTHCHTDECINIRGISTYVRANSL